MLGLAHPSIAQTVDADAAFVRPIPENPLTDPHPVPSWLHYWESKKYENLYVALPPASAQGGAATQPDGPGEELRARAVKVLLAAAGDDRPVTLRAAAVMALGRIRDPAGTDR